MHAALTAGQGQQGLRQQQSASVCIVPASIPVLSCRLGDRTLTVSYAEPKQSEMNQDQVKSVYVGGLTAAATEAGLKDFFVALDVGAVRAT